MIATKWLDVHQEYKIGITASEWAIKQVRESQEKDEMGQLRSMISFDMQFRTSMLVEICKEIVAKSDSLEDAIKNINLKFGME